VKVDRELKEILKAAYGGPSLSFEDGEFVLYTWGDAPTGTTVLAHDRNLKSMIKKIKRELK
jgi:hypothetical protein